MIDPSTRRQILDFVRPLDASLDGVTNFGQVESRLARLDRLRNDETGLDDDLLFLLTVFLGRAKWLGKMGHESRTRIFLEGAGFPARFVRDFFVSLSRAERAPERPEEKLASDAENLEKIGATGLVQGIVQAYKERLDLSETADELVAAQSELEFFTDTGQALAAERIAFAREFAAQLRREIEIGKL